MNIILIKAPIRISEQINLAKTFCKDYKLKLNLVKRLFKLYYREIDNG